MILNRIGDFGLVIGILIVFVEYKAVDYATVFAITPIFIGNKEMVEKAEAMLVQYEQAAV